MQQNHKKKFQKVMQNFTTFRNTVYFRGFLRSCIWYFLPLLIWFLALICLSVTLSGFFPGGTVVLAFCLLVYLICGVFYWTDYYRSIIQNALKMETIKKKI